MFGGMSGNMAGMMKKVQKLQTQMKMMQEELKTMPFNEVWDEYCARCGKPLDGEWFSEVERYEQEVLSKRG